MRKFSLFKFAMIFMILILFHTFMQASIRDDRIDCKSFEEAFAITDTGVSIKDILGISLFKVSSLYPVNVLTDKSRKGTTICHTFRDDLRLKNIYDTWITTPMSTLTSECSCIGSYGSKLINSLNVNFSSYPSENNSLNCKSITSTIHGNISSLDHYKKSPQKTHLTKLHQPNPLWD